MIALPQAHPSKTPRGIRLLQAAWLAFTGMIVLMLLVNAPAYAVDARYEWIVELARPAFEPFISLRTFSEYLVLLRWLSTGVFLATAVFIAWRRFDDWQALLVSATLFMIAFTFVMRSNWDTWRYPARLVAVFPAVEMVFPLLCLALFISFFYLFPSGRLVARWLIAPLLLALGASILFQLLTFLPLQSSLPLVDTYGWYIWSAIFFTAAIIGIVSQLVFYRRSATATQQRQTRLVVASLFLWLISMFMTLLMPIDREPWLALLVLHLDILFFTLIPVAILISMLRYRLWGVEIFLNRTLIYGGLMLLVSGAYVLIVGGISALFQTRVSLLAAAVATGVVALLAQPLLTRLRHLVNRVMYGEPDDPVTLLARLGERLETTAVPDETPDIIVNTVAQSLNLPYVAITAPDQTTLAAHGTPPESGFEPFPLLWQGQRIGCLCVAPRAPGERFSLTERHLLENVARQAGTAVYAARLTHQLQRSRERIVALREEERRRVQRDLHDGLGPQLAALPLKIDAARNLLQAEPAAADRQLRELKQQTQAAIATIRRVVYDLRPAALDQLGLVGALRQQAARLAESGTQIDVMAPQDLPEMSAAVEVAAYHIVLEALHNSCQHGRARHCRVQIEPDDGLRLTIDDDGSGLPAGWTPGIGLESMRERSAELGGRCEIASSPHGGTRVTAVLPLDPASPMTGSS